MAANLAETLSAELPDDVLVRSSPARRATATARAIARRSKAAIEIDDDLIEADVGRAEGLTWPELEARHPETAAAILAGGPVDWPGGETSAALHDRASRAAERIRHGASARPLVIVSHGALLHELAIALTTDGTHSLPFAPCGFVRIDL